MRLAFYYAVLRPVRYNRAVTTIVLAAAMLLTPPTIMTKRAIPGGGEEPAGTRKVIVDGRTASLWIPEGWTPPAQGNIQIRIHVHTVPWYIIPEHQAANLKDPLLVMNFGEGSTTYAKPFEKADGLPKWLDATAQSLGLKKNQHIDRLQVCSFSAGYGAVRMWMSQPGNRALLRRVVMCDSFYGSLDPDLPQRTPLKEHVQVWEAFAKDAMAKRCTFVITNSRIQPTSYCSTFEIANALVFSLGGALQMPKGEAAASAPDYPLLERFDRGNFHVWNYAGTDAPAHTVHIRHIPETWKTLDAEGAP